MYCERRRAAFLRRCCRAERPALVFILVGLVLTVLPAIFAGCRQPVKGRPVGETYEKVGRPEVWMVPARSAAAQIGLQPGDIVLEYGGAPVNSFQELLAAESAAAGREVEVVILRDEHEQRVAAGQGRLGFVPNSVRYSGSLALALEAVLGSYGRTVPYSWLAALSGEAFVLTCRTGDLGAWFLGGTDGVFLADIAPLVGLGVRRVFPVDGDSAGTVEVGLAVRRELQAGNLLLVRARWGGHRVAHWGVAVDFDPADSTLRAYTVGSGEPQRLTGEIEEVFALWSKPAAELEAEVVLTNALDRALELGLAVADTGWRTGIDAFDALIVSLDSAPAADAERLQQERFFDLIWTLIGCKQTAGSFFEEMKEAVPEQAELINEITSAHRAITGKLEGLMQAGVSVVGAEDRRRIQLVLNEIQLIENDLLGFYEELLGEL